jgi:hypothetical protein
MGGNVFFFGPPEANTTAMFNLLGTYVIQVEVSDGLATDVETLEVEVTTP